MPLRMRVPDRDHLGAALECLRKLPVCLLLREAGRASLITTAGRMATFLA
jgi:hypothetical protein